MANKKINQLVAKTTIQSTDLFPIGDATTGTLYKKTIADLQAAIGGAVISVNGLVGTVVLDADDILETATPTNRYFTEARARASISLTTTGSSGASTYSSSTGVLNVPTYTLAGLGGITATFLSGGTGISYNSTTGVISYSGTVYTDSSVRALFSGGTGISYNSSTGAISYSGTVYTDSSIRALFSGTSPITYNSTTGAIGITSANLTESTSSVLTITGGTGALLSAASIQVKQASGSQSGFLSSTDWTTFNSKQAALSGGTSGYVTFWTGSNTLSADSGLFWDNTNKRLGIGTTSPSLPLEVNGNIRATSTGTTYFLANRANSTSQTGFQWQTNGTTNWYNYIEDSTNNLFWYGNSNYRMVLTQSGNVGIGTTSPSAALHVVGGIISTGGNYVRAIGTGSDTAGSGPNFGLNDTTPNNYWIWQLSASGHFDLHNYNNAWSQKMRITSGGNVGIGVTGTEPSVGKSLQLNQAGSGIWNAFGYTYFTNNVYYNGGDKFAGTGYAQYLFVGAGTFQFITSNASGTAGNSVSMVTQMMLTTGGNLLLGTTTDNGERLYVSGSIRATGTITANSDINLKKNLAKIENALEKVEQINGYTYEFKEDDSKRHAGVIAQEIQEVLPEIVNKGNDGLLGVEYGNISALLIEAIKDLKSQNESLVARLEALEK